MGRKTIYIAHKISGGTAKDVFSWFDNTKSYLEEFGNFSVLSPMTGKDELRTETRFRADYYQVPVATNHAIFERDRWMVTQADIIFMDLTGTTEPSIGCMMELAWASMLGKHAVVILPDDNPHQHAFVLEAADVIFKTLEEGLEYLLRLS